MQQVAFLQDMAIVMIVGAMVTIICHQFRLPVVLGYILAGLIIGPNTPPYSLITDTHSIHIFSELGVIFLLFGIGLEFSVSKLLKVGFVSFIAATLEILLMLWIGFSLGRAFGWDFMDSLFLGAILSISSTTIIAKILMDTKKIQERYAQIILGILVIEDVLAIVIIAILSGVAFTGTLDLASAWMSFLKIGGFIAGILLLGTLLVPRILNYIQTFQSSEMMTISVLGLCFGVSLLAAKFGFSVALGAFLIGAVIAETRQAQFINRHLEAIRDMFTAFFFVSVGMLLNPQIVVKFAVPIAVITVVTILGKVFSCSAATFLAGDRPSTAFRVGLGLAQIGEFSFIIARLGESTAVTSSFIFPIAVAVSGITTMTTPLLMKYADPLVTVGSRLMPKPILTFLGLYHEWIKGIQSGKSSLSSRFILVQNLKIYFPKILFYFVCLLLLANGPFWLVRAFGFSLPIAWSLVAIVGLPCLFGFLSTFDELLWQTFATRYLQPGQGRYEKEAKELLHNVLRFAASAILGLTILTTTPFINFSQTVTLAVIVVIGLTSAILWDSIRKVHQGLEKTIFGFFDKESMGKLEQAKAYDELFQTIQQRYPWGVETQDFILPYEESALNKSIKDLDLRAKTGATIVAIYRDSETIINPKPEILLLPGDVLLLMGSKEQADKALKFLNQAAREPASD